METRKAKKIQLKPSGDESLEGNANLAILTKSFGKAAQDVDTLAYKEKGEVIRISKVERFRCNKNRCRAGTCRGVLKGTRTLETSPADDAQDLEEVPDADKVTMKK